MTPIKVRSKSMARLIAIAWITILLVATIARTWSLVGLSPSVAGPRPEVVRELCLANDFQTDLILASPAAKEMGLESASRLVFDPAAEVLLAPGGDLRPGQAEVDDDADGVVDNSSELGAMYSDDLCLTPTDEGYSLARTNEDYKVISRNAYIFDDDRSDDRPSRLVLSGRSNGQDWQRMVVER